MKRALYPGTFDPVTFGHIDIIERSAAIFDEVVIGVLKNNQKNPVFSIEERVEMIEHEVAEIPNVTVVSFNGLLVDFCRQKDLKFVIRGLRAVTDYEYELQMAQTNKVMSPELDTIFMTASHEYAYLSSSVVREVASYGGDISKFVSPYIEKKIKDKLKSNTREIL